LLDLKNPKANTVYVWGVSKPVNSSSSSSESESTSTLEKPNGGDGSSSETSTSGNDTSTSEVEKPNGDGSSSSETSASGSDTSTNDDNKPSGNNTISGNGVSINGENNVTHDTLENSTSKPSNSGGMSVINSAVTTNLVTNVVNDKYHSSLGMQPTINKGYTKIGPNKDTSVVLPKTAVKVANNVNAHKGWYAMLVVLVILFVSGLIDMKSKRKQ
jgi:hypothetical protein